jgi:cation transport regulator ChaB
VPASVWRGVVRRDPDNKVMAAQVRGGLKAHAVNIFFEAFEKAAGVLFTGWRGVVRRDPDKVMAAQVRGDLKAHAVNIFFEAFEKAAGVLFTYGMARRGSP